jgi:uncharacterized OsmC-like protein
MPETTVNLRARQGPLREAFRTDPASARATTSARTLVHDATDPLHCRAAPTEFPELVIDAGLHRLAGGDHAYPCSGDILATALAVCEESTIRSVAANMGIELDSVQVEADVDWDFRGIMATDPSVPVGAVSAKVRSRVKVKEGVDAERARRFLMSAERYCAVLQTLRSGVAVETSFELD